MTTGDAGVLREAAALMRERAQAATPGPWCYYNGDLWRGHAEALHAYDADPENAPWPYGPDEDPHLFAGDPEHPTDAEYIAAMPPAVALAVADWLDYTASYVPRGKHGWTDAMRHALAVATAYLGEPSP